MWIRSTRTSKKWLSIISGKYFIHSDSLAPILRSDSPQIPPILRRNMEEPILCRNMEDRLRAVDSVEHVPDANEQVSNPRVLMNSIVICDLIRLIIRRTRSRGFDLIFLCGYWLVNNEKMLIMRF